MARGWVEVGIVDEPPGGMLLPTGSTMRKLLPTVALLASALSAQTYYVPDNLANAGTCNVIPFGSASPSGSFYTCLTQQIVTAADLGNLPGVITGLGFAACGSGKSRFTQLQVIMDVLPPSSTLSTTFANNLTPNAVTVLDASNYAWHTTSNSWMDIGLQNYFVYDGVSDLVIQILANQSTSPAGFHRSTTKPRLYAVGWTGSPPATGTYSANTAQKMEFSLQMARSGTFGDGCVGSNALAPKMVLSGTPQLGQTQNLDLAQAPASSAAFLVTGFGNGFPFPFELSSYGMPGCYQYFGPASTQLSITDPSGVALVPFAVPNSSGVIGILLYAQWACLDLPANALGITTSDYARMLIGS